MHSGDFEYSLPLQSVRLARISALPCSSQPSSPGDIDIMMLPGLKRHTPVGSSTRSQFGGDTYYRQWAEAYAFINRQGRALVEDIQRRAVSGFPTKVIISPDGTICKVVVGENPEFYTFIDSLLQ